MSTLVPLSSNSRGQVSSLPAGATSWLLASDKDSDCAQSGAEQVRAAKSAGIRNRLNRALGFATRRAEDVGNLIAVQGVPSRPADTLPIPRRRCFRRLPGRLFVFSRNQSPQPNRRNRPSPAPMREFFKFVVLCLINLFRCNRRL